MSVTAAAFAKALADNGSVKAACRALGITEWRGRQLNAENTGMAPPRKGRERIAERPGVIRRGDTATITTDPRKPEDLGDLAGLLKRRGLNPQEWEVITATVNEWEAYAGRDKDTDEPRIETLRQLRVHIKRRVDLDWLFPAVEVATRHTPAPAARTVAPGELGVLCGDQQADYHDEELHQAFLRWLADVQPAWGVLLGDTQDFPTISRHPDKPFWNSTPQRCIDAAYRLLSDYRDAGPDVRWRKLRGNHDIRLETELLLRAERMFGLKPADIPGEEQIAAYSLRNLLHLDTLGIELVGREGDDWKVAELSIGEHLAARHQPPNRDKWLRLNRDLIAGDTHKQSVQHVTVFDSEDRPVIRTRIEAGCMCRTDGLGYTEHPDWQPGFATAVAHDDGSFSYDLAVWRGGYLTWRGERW